MIDSPDRDAMEEISPTTWWLTAAATVAAVTLSCVVYAGQLGFWEPFESGVVRADVGGEDVQLRLEVLDDCQRDLDADCEDTQTPGLQEITVDEVTIDSTAVPVLDGELRPMSLLRTIWTSRLVDEAPIAESGQIGETERRARAPLIALMVLLLGAAMLWARRHLGDGAAAMTAVVLATSPVVYLGAIFISGPLVAVAASALAIMAFFQSVYEERFQMLWAIVGALALVVVAVDQKLVGVVATVAVIVGLSIAECIDEDGDDDGADFDLLFAAVVVVVGGLWAAGWFVSRGYDEGLLLPQLVEAMWIVGPVVLFGGLALAARDTPVGRALVGWRGLIFVVPAVVILAVVGAAYASAMPAQLESVERGRLAVGYLLEQYTFGADVEATGNFSWWWRQLGFGLFPHVLLLLPATGYLAWKLRPESGAEPVERAIAQLCLVWPVAAFVVYGFAAPLGHSQFPAFFPLAVAIGWMIADGEFWGQLRLRPAIYFAVAIAVLFSAVILTGDPEDFPQRLIDFVIGGIDEPGLSDDFDVTGPVELWARVMIVGVGAYFVGVISWMAFLWGDLKRLKDWGVRLLKRLAGGWKNFRQKSPTNDKDEPLQSGQQTGEPGADEDHRSADSNTSPGRRRMAQREQWRDSRGVLAQMARRLERLPGLVGLFTVAGLGWMAVYFAAMIDDFDDELSSRAVVEQFLEVRDGESLLRYGVGQQADHFYVRGLDSITDRRQFNEQFSGDERIFALIAADELAQIHSTTRRDHERNPPILASGGGMYLLSNQLLDGEIDQNPISEFVFDELEDDYISLGIEVDDQMEYPEFDRRIEFVGYRFDRGSEEQMPVYAWGDTMEITQYFRVQRRIPRAQEIFLHIDLGGSRIHGDHEPVGGLYPTNRWRRGDVIKNVHQVDIERFSTPGTYTVYTGFYDDGGRMSIEPDEVHDGEDRLDMATIEVVPF